VDQDSRP